MFMTKKGKRYWFKFYNNFFENEKVKILKRRKDGDRLIVIFIHCLVIASTCESCGYLKISENKFFTIKDLAYHMGRNQESVRSALEIFQEYSMVVLDDYGYKIKNWNKYQGLQEVGIKYFKQSTKNIENVDTEKEIEEEKESEKYKEIGGEKNGETKMEDFV